MKLLTTWGLNINEEIDLIFQTPFHHLIISMSYLPDFKGVLDFLILNDAFDSDGSLFASMVRGRYFFTHYGRFGISSPEIFKELQPLLWPRHYELTIIDRLKYFGFEHCGHVKRSPPKAQTLCYILREDGVIQEKDVIELQQQGINLLNLAVYCRSYCKIYGDGDHYGWEELCRKLIPITADLSYNQAPMQLLPQDSMELPSGTPLFLAISGKGWLYLCIARLTWSIRKYLKAWLEDLHACGVDLQKYGYTEKKRFSANGWFGNIWFGNRLFVTRGLSKMWCGHFHGAYDWNKYGDVKVKLINFDVGSRPEDWAFHWDMDAERYAGQFWDLIENPPSRVPGSWVDDDENLYYSSIDEYDSDDELESG